MAGEAPEAAPKADVVQAVDAAGSGQRSSWTMMSLAPSASSIANVEVSGCKLEACFLKVITHDS